MGTTRTLSDELAWATRSLEEVGIDTARLDAEILLAHQLRTDRTGLVLRGGERITGDSRTRYLALVARRASYEPVAYITGKQAFRHLDLAVDPRVLIPRPETEGLVEIGLDLPKGARVVDVGTGSGAVALALKQERPDLQVSGLDISAGAINVARFNAQRLRLDVHFATADLLDADADRDGDANRDGDGDANRDGDDEGHSDRRPDTYDAVLANLPYVKDGEILPPDVGEYEPDVALYGGEDGLGLVRRLMAQIAERPAITFVALEIGYTQGPATVEAVQAGGFPAPELRLDLAGRDRVVVGRR
jgi:release factor glutamine methyltransferase